MADASTGPIPIIRGCTPAAPLLTRRANGFNPCCLIPSSEANKIAAAPSFKVEALAAVTVPSFLNTGFSVGILSKFKIRKNFTNYLLA
jgi:hypothetical protein